MVIGNSSSGLTEVPSFKIPTINIGDRQKGRIIADSVINCEPNEISIVNAIQKALSADFQNRVKSTKNPYGEPGASKRIVEILKSQHLDGILKKEFYDL
jgi:GDP/UDP-N,N'-diacetylbacillosamine 2-epimerase (hydrolysing)